MITLMAVISAIVLLLSAVRLAMASPSDFPNVPSGSPTSPSSPATQAAESQRPDVDDLEQRDPGLARERTSLAWGRTAISFAALGGTVLKANVVGGLVILLIAPLIWWLGRMRNTGVERLWLITMSIVAVAMVALVVALVSDGASHVLGR